MAKKWPEQRWRRKWSEIIDSLIRSLIGRDTGETTAKTDPPRRQTNSGCSSSLATKVNKGAEKAMRKPHEASESRHAASA